jgi:hypothetical protein
MFGNQKRGIRITLDKTKKTENSTPGENEIIHPQTVKLIAERSKEVVKYVALTAIGAYAAFKAIDTVSQIAIKKTKSADQE